MWETEGRGKIQEVAAGRFARRMVVDYEDSFSQSKKRTSATLYVNHAAGHCSKEGAKHEDDGVTTSATIITDTV